MSHRVEEVPSDAVVKAEILCSRQFGPAAGSMWRGLGRVSAHLRISALVQDRPGQPPSQRNHNISSDAKAKETMNATIEQG